MCEVFPTRVKYTLNNGSHQHNLPTDDSEGSREFVKAIKNGGAPNGKRPPPGEEKDSEEKNSGEKTDIKVQTVKDDDDDGSSSSDDSDYVDKHTGNDETTC